MTAVCEYHPTKPAEWNWPNCNDSFCADCVDKRVIEQHSKKNVFYFCLKCNVRTEGLAYQNGIVPF